MTNKNKIIEKITETTVEDWYKQTGEHVKHNTILRYTNDDNTDWIIKIT